MFIIGAAAACRMSSAGVSEPVETYLDPSYTNYMGSGDRTMTDMYVSSNMSFGGGGTIDSMIDGTIDNFAYFQSGQSGRYFTFSYPYGVLITEAKWYQDNGSTHGVWQWKASNDLTTWTNIGSTFTLGGTTQVITALNSNTIRYKHYRMEQMSGTTSSSPYTRQIEFKIDERVGGQPYSYRNRLGQGSRLGSLNIFSNRLNGYAQLLDGAYNNTIYFDGSFTDAYIIVDVGASDPRVIKEIHMRRNGSSNVGTWKCRASNDRSTWTDVSTPVVWDQVDQFFDLSSNTTPYRFYELVQTSGTTSNAHYIREMRFLIDATVSPWTSYTRTSNSNQANIAGWTVRTVIGAAQIGAGNRVRVRIDGSAALSGVSVDKVYIGKKAASGDAWDFAATPTQVLFNGSPSFGTAIATPILSDEIVMDVEDTDSLIVSFSVPSGANSDDIRSGPSISEWQSYYRTADDAATVNSSGYTPLNAIVGVFRIDLRTV